MIDPLLAPGIFCKWNPRLSSLTNPVIQDSKASHGAKLSAHVCAHQQIMQHAECIEQIVCATCTHLASFITKYAVKDSFFEKLTS